MQCTVPTWVRLSHLRAVLLDEQTHSIVRERLSFRDHFASLLLVLLLRLLVQLLPHGRHFLRHLTHRHLYESYSPLFPTRILLLNLGHLLLEEHVVATQVTLLRTLLHLHLALLFLSLRLLRSQTLALLDRLRVRLLLLLAQQLHDLRGLHVYRLTSLRLHYRD